MSDDNRDLINQIARRPEEPERIRVYNPDGSPADIVARTKTGRVLTELDIQRLAEEAATDWNSPIDTTQADSMTLRMWIHGRIAEAKDVARRWEPRPLPQEDL